MALKPVNNETEILLGVANGSQHAFSELFNAYNDSLALFVFNLTSSQDATAEIIQDVFLKIWLNREKLPEIKQFTAYLFILTRNHSLNYLRKVARSTKEHHQYCDNILVENMAWVGEEPAQPDYHSLIEKAVELLPAVQQKIFLLRQQGFKNSEIVDQVNMPAETVKKYQYRALKSIARIVKEQLTLLLAVFILLK